MNTKSYVLGICFVILCVSVANYFYNVEDGSDLTSDTESSKNSSSGFGVQVNANRNSEVGSAAIGGATPFDSLDSLKQINLSFVDETGDSVPIRRVIARFARNAEVQGSFQKTEDFQWQGDLLSGSWELLIKPVGQNRWHKERLFVNDDRHLEIVLKSEIQKVQFLLKDPDGNPVMGSCTATWRRWSSALQKLTGMSLWTKAWPIGMEDLSSDESTDVLFGPSINLSLQSGSKYFITFRTRTGLFAAQWITPPLNGSQSRIVVVLRKPEKRQFRIVSPIDSTERYQVQLISDLTWTRSDWTVSIDEHAGFVVSGFRPFMAGNYAFLKLKGPAHGDLPVGIAELPNPDKLAWQNSSTVAVDFGDLYFSSWTWVGKPKPGAELVFQLIHPRDRGEKVNVGAKVGTVDWARKIELPIWTTSRTMQCLLVKKGGLETMVEIDVENRQLRAKIVGQLRLRFVTNDGQPIRDVQVSLRPRLVAATSSVKRLQNSSSLSDGTCEIALPINSEDAILEIRHPDFQYSEIKVAEMAMGLEENVTLLAVEDCQLSFRWVDDSALKINGSVQIRSKFSSIYRRRNGKISEEVREGQSNLELSSGPGKYSVRLFLDSLSMEYKKQLDIDGANIDIAIKAPVRSEIAVATAGQALRNLVLLVQYTDELGWMQRSIGEIENGIAVLFGPARPGESVTVEVRMKHTNSTFDELRFSQLILHTQMTFGELLQGLMIPRMEGGGITIVTGPKDVVVSIRSEFGSMLRKLPSDDKYEMALPVGTRWESRLSGTVPFTIARNRRIDASLIVDINSFQLDPVLVTLVDGRIFTINVQSRFYEDLRFQMIPRNMRMLEGSRCHGELRVEGRSESIPFSGVVVGNTLRIIADSE